MLVLSGNGMLQTCQIFATLLSDFQRTAANGSIDRANVTLSRAFRSDRERRCYVARGSGCGGARRVTPHVVVKERDAIEFFREHKTRC